MIEEIEITGIVDITLYSFDGKVKHQETINNLVTTAGKNFIVRKIISDSEEISSIGIGSGTTVATLSDSDLESVLANEPVRFQFIDTVETNILFNVTTFEENVGTGTINEVGLFSDSSPQNLLCRTVVTTPFVKDATDYLNVSWKIKIG